MTVPAFVPSDFHSCWPCFPSLSEKNRVLPTAVRLVGPYWYRPPLRLG